VDEVMTTIAEEEDRDRAQEAMDRSEILDQADLATIAQEMIAVRPESGGARRVGWAARGRSGRAMVRIPTRSLQGETKQERGEQRDMHDEATLAL
jgi:hypothetical protein